MFSSTEYQGKRFGSWKTSPSFASASSSRRSPRHSDPPSTRTSPSVGRIRPARIRSIVVFPQPDWPISTTNSLRPTLTLTSLSASVEP
jgi:hypothetical protein